MLAEVLLFLPSVARFREGYLQNRLERAQIASLTLIERDEISEDLAAELLENAEVFNVALRRNDVSELILWSPLPGQIDAVYDLRDASIWVLMRDAVTQLGNPSDRLLRVIDEPVKQAGSLIEVTISSQPLRMAMIDFGQRILLLSIAIAVFTGLLLFLAARALIVRPMERVVDKMADYAQAPEDARHVMTPNSKIVEIHDAETALSSMQKELTAALKQRERLAQLGEAVAKISHDLRNILTSAQLFTDRIEQSEDPAVARTAPKLVRSIQRAVSLCENALSFGKAQEPAPQRVDLDLAVLLEDVMEAETLAIAGDGVTLTNALDTGTTLRADPEQLHRALTNLIRNAAQAMAGAGREGDITVTAIADEKDWVIRVEDQGPGVPDRARENLLKPFKGSVRKGGTGLGLAIAEEIARGHGGSLRLEKSDEAGAVFALRLPK